MDEVYVLYQCGTDEPSGEPLQSAFAQVDAGGKDPKIFSVPLKAVAVESTVPIAMMVGSDERRFAMQTVQAVSEDLNLIPRITYLPSYVASSCAQFVLGCQENSFNATLESHVESVDAVIRSDTPSWPGSYPAELEPLVIQFSASQDPGALARVEWHKFLGLFFNKASRPQAGALHLLPFVSLEARDKTVARPIAMDLPAEELYQKVAESFNSHVENAAALNAPPTKVAWCTYNAVASWNPVPSVVCYVGGTYKYKKDLVEAAGGELLDSDNSDGSSITFSLDTQAGIDALRAFLLGADAVVDETYSANNNNYTLASFME
eukprot:scaffold48151_cov46-Prasinocladus_malaysianus.AAC.1